MPDVVRLRNNYGHEVEVDVRGPNPQHGDVVEVPGRLVTDEAEYRALMGLPDATPVTEAMAEVHLVYGTLESKFGTHLRGWPKSVWDLVTEAPSKVDTKAKG